MGEILTAEEKKERKRLRDKLWYEKKKETHRLWHEANKEKARAYSREYYYNNKDKSRSRREKRRQIKIRARPSWYESEKGEIKKLYRKAKELGLVVDHIVPLNSKVVCGLHTLSNLQLLDPVENRKKYNLYLEELV
jgi:hypothetical protein